MDLDRYYRRHLPHYQPEGETYHVIFRLVGSIPADVLEELRFQREQEGKRIASVKNEEEKARLLRDHRWKYFERIERLLDGDIRGPFWLRKPEVAAIVNEAIHYRDQKSYDLIASTIMPNHVHMVFRLLEKVSDVVGLRRDGVPSYNASVRRVSDPTRAGRDNPPKDEALRVNLPENTTGRGKVPSYRVTNIIGSIKKYSALRANRTLSRRGAFWHSESYDHVIRNDEELERTIEYVLMNPVKAGLCKDWRDWKWSYVTEGYVGD